MYTIQLPDLNENSYTENQVILKDKQYSFTYRWLDDFCILDIKYNDTYLVKGRAITTGSNLIGRVKDDDLITGKLFLINKYGYSVQPEQENFNTDYYLIWVE